jgi:pyrimidine operon attenuation protein/uracil phosphoribosyltransferase
MSSGNIILTKDVAEKKLQRMAYEIAERNAGEDGIVLAGVKESGYVIAGKIKTLLSEIFKGTVTIIGIELDKKNPGEIKLSPVTVFDNKVVILIDDVANTGKTLTYSLQPFLTYHPKKIQTLVLVERTHKLFPVKSDYVGLSVATTIQDNIIVEVVNGEVTGAWLQ